MRSVSSKVFVNGNSQAVRIPQEFRLDTRDVEISRLPSGDLVVVAAIEAVRGDRLPAQDGAPL